MKFLKWFKFDWFKKKKNRDYDGNYVWDYIPNLPIGTSNVSRGVKSALDTLKDYHSYLEQELTFNVKSIDTYRQGIADANARIDVVKKAIPEYEALIKKLEEK